MSDNEPGVSIAALRRTQAENERPKRDYSGRMEVSVRSFDISFRDWVEVMLKAWAASIVATLILSPVLFLLGAIGFVFTTVVCAGVGGQ